MYRKAKQWDFIWAPEASQIKATLQFAQIFTALSPVLLLVPHNRASQSMNKEQLFYVSSTSINLSQDHLPFTLNWHIP
jgi:hypothetical protein